VGENRWEKWHLSPRNTPDLTRSASIVLTLAATTEEFPPHMLFLVVLIIALGWAGLFWSWGRGRFVSNSGFDLHSNPFAPRSTSPLAPPRTAVMARRRRREVLGALGLMALITLLVARAWTPFWTMQVLVDLALLVYGWAVLTLERPRLGQESGMVTRPRPQPVLSGSRSRHQPGPKTQ
jgi:hypothetical protein